VLQGFACGDTPTLAALQSLTTDLAGRGDAFELDLLALGDAHDLRPLVLRTALTHLELLGVIKQGTPVYASYQVKPLIPVPDIVARFSGDKGAFIDAIFGAGKTGRIWTHLSLDDVAVALGQDRQRIMRAWTFSQNKAWRRFAPPTSGIATPGRQRRWPRRRRQRRWRRCCMRALSSMRPVRSLGCSRSWTSWSPTPVRP